MPNHCPVCTLDAKVQGVLFDRQLRHVVECPQCGSYQITDESTNYLEHHLKSEIKNMRLSHAILKMQKNVGEAYPFLSHKQVLQILDSPAPKPGEQINNFILWLGDNIPALGDKVKIDRRIIQAEIGAVTLEGVNTIIDHLVEEKIVKEIKIAGAWEGTERELTLMIKGWEYYENLKRGSISSRKAFMAMQYGEKELDEIVAKYFRPAVKAAGFDLYRLDDVHKAGLIDDRLKVEIRTSRFLIADLTHENRGAYWEAGFAQGLGKPVIYTCEASKFDQQYTHFDTNHHTTIKWDRNNLEQAAIDLKNTIRETLPEEAKLTDDE